MVPLWHRATRGDLGYAVNAGRGWWGVTRHPFGSFGAVEAAGSFEDWGVGAVALHSVAAVSGVVVCRPEVAWVVGAAACEGDDVVDGVGSGFAADVACVGVAEDAGAELSPGGVVGGASGWGLHVSPFRLWGRWVPCLPCLPDCV